MIIDAILLTTIALFGLWVINKHYDNAYEIEKLQLKIRDQWGLTNKQESTKSFKATVADKYTGLDIKSLRNGHRTLSTDMKTMQDDLIEFRQSLINIDAKYKLKDKWCVDTIEEITQLQSKMMKEVI
tara:strand:- start:420 stop:800 length:381 start_codon:yes stop_codon:yes gene_type:complete